jgi:hypothetical protein
MATSLPITRTSEPGTVAERYADQLTPDALQRNISRRIRSANSVDEVFGGVQDSITEGLASFEKMLYEPIIVHDVTMAPSRYPGAGVYGVYLVSRAKPAPGSKSKTLCEWVPDGSAFPVACGAANVMEQLDVAKERGWLPLALQIVPNAKPTSSGYNPYWARVIDSNHELVRRPTPTSDEPF